MASGSHKTVAVTGATGFLGRHAVRALLDAGFHVRGLIRDVRKSERTLGRPEGLIRIEGDILDPTSLRELVASADAVVHTVGIRREIPPKITFERLHTRATARIVDAARAAGVPRFIQISALGTRANAPTDYYRTKYDAESIVRRSALDWTILRPSIIHGPDGEFVDMVRQWVLGRAAPRFFLPYFARVELTPSFPPRPKLIPAHAQPVHVDDVAKAIVRSLERPESVGEVIPLVGPEPVDWPTMLKTFRDNMPIGHKHMPAFGIPAPAAVAMARAAKAVGLAGALPFGPGEPVMGSEENTANPARARAVLGIEPVAFAQGVRGYADRL